jgi:hypothetical protein
MLQVRPPLVLVFFTFSCDCSSRAHEQFAIGCGISREARRDSHHLSSLIAQDQEEHKAQGAALRRTAQATAFRPNETGGAGGSDLPAEKKVRRRWR